MNSPSTGLFDNLLELILVLSFAAAPSLNQSYRALGAALCEPVKLFSYFTR